MTCSRIAPALAFTLAVASAAAPVSAEPAAGEEVEITAGAVTALSCALAAQKSGDLTLLGACPLVEARAGIVVFDVAEKAIYRISTKKVFRYELERAFGGGSIDLTGRVAKVDAKTGIPTVDVETYSVVRKPKPGSFKGCL